MAIENKDDFLTGLKTLIGDDTSDNALSVLEYASKIGADSEQQITELTTQIETLKTEKQALLNEKDELDKSWRTKYRDTFYSGTPAVNPEGGANHEHKPAKKFEDLFIEKKE